MSGRNLYCEKCQGEGQLYTSRYGGNDPDVWATGTCPVCEGGGHAICEERGCKERAVGFDDDGNALCEDCLFEWMSNLADEELP
jgi:hypothetical protein